MKLLSVIAQATVLLAAAPAAAAGPAATVGGLRVSVMPDGRYGIGMAGSSVFALTAGVAAEVDGRWLRSPPTRSSPTVDCRRAPEPDAAAAIAARTGDASARTTVFDDAARRLLIVAACERLRECCWRRCWPSVPQPSRAAATPIARQTSPTEEAARRPACFATRPYGKTRSRI